MQAKTFLIILFLALSNVGMAQVRISTSDLNGTKWKIKSSSNGYYVYTAEKEIWYDEKGKPHSSPYYLSDQPIYSYEGSLFDHSKVGKGTKGCYMIILNTVTNVIYCFSIEQFDKEKGTMADKLISKDCIGAGTNHYIMIK